MFFGVKVKKPVEGVLGWYRRLTDKGKLPLTTQYHSSEVFFNVKQTIKPLPECNSLPSINITLKQNFPCVCSWCYCPSWLRYWRWPQTPSLIPVVPLPLSLPPSLHLPPPLAPSSHCPLSPMSSPPALVCPTAMTVEEGGALRR